MATLPTFRPGMLILAALLVLGALVGAQAPWRPVLDNFGKYPQTRPVESEGGKQWVLLYFGRSTCVWCNHPEMPGAFERITSSIQREASARGVALVVIGVALDGRANDGIRHLAKIGSFHEISAGLGPENTVALSRLWSGFGPPTGTPQLVLFERAVTDRKSVV